MVRMPEVEASDAHERRLPCSVRVSDNAASVDYRTRKSHQYGLTKLRAYVQTCMLL